MLVVVAGALLEDLCDDKLPVICRGQATAQAIDAALKERLRIRTTSFHERLSLIQRDRNAPFFADRDFLCSRPG